VKPRAEATIAEEHGVSVPGKRGQRSHFEPGEVPLLSLAGTHHDEAVVPLAHGDEDAAIGGNVVDRDRPGHPGQDALLAC
jgi:hypothetical protein